MAYSDTSLGEKIFDVSAADIETIVQPDGVTDYVGWESMTFVCIHTPILSK